MKLFGIGLSKYAGVLTDDEKRTELQFSFVYSVLAMVSGFMTIVNLATDKKTLMLVTLAFAVLCIINRILVSLNKTAVHISIILFCAELIAMLTFFIISGIPEGFSSIWVCMVPASGLFLFGRRRGTILCVFMFAVIVFLFYIPYGNDLLRFEYTASFKLRFPMLYLAFFAVSFILETVRSMTGDAVLEVKRKYEFLYSHDALTNLFNRYGFNEHLEAMLQTPSEYETALMIIDVDHFKTINDRYGHITGDDVLKKLAAILEEKVGTMGTVCRWGGEEFALLFNGFYNFEGIAESVRSSVEASEFKVNGDTIHITISIGMVTADKNRYILAKDMICKADACMYKAKEAGRNRVVSERYICNDEKQKV